MKEESTPVILSSSNRVAALKQSLLQFFKSRSSLSLLSTNEAVLQAVAEISLPDNRIPELTLIIKKRETVNSDLQIFFLVAQ